MAAGGNEALVKVVGYVDGAPLDIVEDIAVIDQMVADHGFQLVYIDQVLDNSPRDMSSHTQKDVRQSLGPLRNVARKHRIVAEYTAHPNKSAGAGVSLRDRTGGSGQYVDVPRSGLFLGFHPDRDGWRAVGRGKGNMGRVPPVLTFTIEGSFTANPVNGEVVDIGVVMNLEEDPELTVEGILPHPAKPKPPSAQFEFERVMFEVGKDRDWHSRQEAEVACARAEVSQRSFRELFPQCDFIERDQRGRETWWEAARRGVAIEAGPLTVTVHVHGDDEASWKGARAAFEAAQAALCGNAHIHAAASRERHGGIVPSGDPYLPQKGG